MITPFTRPLNDFEVPLAANYVPGSGTLLLADLSGLPGGMPSVSAPLRFSIDRNRDGAKTILVATGRSGAYLTGCAVAEGKIDIPMDAGDLAKIRLSAGYISDLQDAHQALESLVGSGGGSSSQSFSATNRSGTTMLAGSCAAIHSSGTGVVLATSADNLHAAVGLLAATVLAGASATVVTSGTLTLSDWTAVAGSTTLAARATYYLSTGGTLSSTAPTTPGNTLQVIGVAVAPTILDIDILPPILL